MILKNSPIIVTGSHRSGTTWVGQIINLSNQVGYIFEPFRPNHHPAVLNCTFNYWFTFIDRHNEKLYYNQFKKLIDFKFHFIRGLFASRSIKRLKQFFDLYSDFKKFRNNNLRCLIKDPIAFFSVNWLVNKFNFQPIILIRHPAAFVSSILRFGFNHPFSHFLQQTELMETYLFPFRDEIIEYSREKKNLIDQGILLWKIFHHTIKIYKEEHPEYLYIRHEDLSVDPINNFKRIYEHLDLSFNDVIKNQIEFYSSEKNPMDSAIQNSIYRNSRKSIKNWKNRLSKYEISIIRGKTDYIAHSFYEDNDW